MYDLIIDSEVKFREKLNIKLYIKPGSWRPAAAKTFVLASFPEVIVGTKWIYIRFGDKVAQTYIELDLYYRLLDYHGVRSDWED